MYMKQNHPYDPVLCDECGCERRVLVSLTAFYLCLGCLEEANKTVAVWQKNKLEGLAAEKSDIETLLEIAE
jgi:hypothetical protein